MSEIMESTDASAGRRGRTSRAAVFRGAGPLELCELAIPDVGPQEALVRVECCTICGSDLHTYSGARTEATPSILGHEILGVVEEVGDPPLRDVAGKALRPGERVTWSTSISCGACDRCRRGLPQKCRSLAKYGHERAVGRTALSGGLAEYILLRSGTAAVKLDRQIPDAVICPVNCATATVAAALRVAGEVAGRRVLIFGAGMLGLTAAAFARTLDASQVVVCDPDARRLERAVQFGAERTVRWEDDPDVLRRSLGTDSPDGRFDVILELSGASAAVEAACDAAEIAAQVVLVGSVMHCRPARIDPEQVVRRWLSLRGVHNYAAEDLRAAVAFLAGFGAAFPFEQLVESEFPLSRVNEALERALRERPVRVAIHPQWS